MPDDKDKDKDKATREKEEERVEKREEAELEETLKEESDSGFSLSDDERRNVEASSPPRLALVHEIVRRAGNEELKRNTATLAWSAFAAGLTMGFSFLARAVLHRHAEGLPAAYLVEGFGYTFGFLAVIIARQQLFTENTLTAVLPVMTLPTRHNFGRLLRLWSVVLAGNMVGATVFAFGLLHFQQFDQETQSAYVAVGTELMDNTALQMFTKGILAGWIIAMMVWMTAATERSRLALIIICTYVIAIGGFTHIVVGASEAMYMVFAGHASLADAVFRFGLPTLAGNVVGGSLIFALISHAQVRSGGD